MGGAAVTRRFFVGAVESRPPAAPVRPPWARAEVEFLSFCTSCGVCRDVCPQGVLRMDAQGRPVFDPMSSHCTFCGKCVEGCVPEALSKTIVPTWSVSVAVDGSQCLSEQGTICRSCGEQCEVEAISFRPLGRGRWAVGIDVVTCTGCGACLSVCPSKALGLRSRAVVPEAA